MMYRRMRVLHTADWHLGKNRKYHDYLDQQKYMIEAILGQIVRAISELEEDQKLWFILAGDVFDRNEDTQRAEFVLFMTSFFFPLMQLKETWGDRLDIDIIDGNHDRQPKVDEPSVLTPLLTLSPDIQLVDARYDEERRVLLIPFQHITEKQFKELLAKYPAHFIVGHECLARMRTDIGYSPPRDQDNYVEINNILTSEIVAIFMGDIHKCQALDEDERCWYSGSPATLDHGHKLPKGVLHHFFCKNDAGTWIREKPPQLLALEAPKLRVHYQLGVLTDPENLPHKFFRLLNEGAAYLQMVVSQEVYQRIEIEYPNLLRSPYVTHDIMSALKNPSDTSHEEIKEDDHSGQMFAYYRRLIDQWLDENTEGWAQEAKAKCRDQIYRDFEKRT